MMKTYRIYSQSSGSFTISVDGIKAEEYISCPICSAYRKQEHKSEKKLNVNLDKGAAVQPLRGGRTPSTRRMIYSCARS